MKIERRSDNQIMIKMTMDDLEENGLTIEDLSVNAGDKVRKFIETLVDDMVNDYYPDIDITKGVPVIEVQIRDREDITLSITVLDKDSEEGKNYLNNYINGVKNSNRNSDNRNDSNGPGGLGGPGGSGGSGGSNGRANGAGEGPGGLRGLNLNSLNNLNDPGTDKPKDGEKKGIKEFPSNDPINNELTINQYLANNSRNMSSLRVQPHGICCFNSIEQLIKVAKLSDNYYDSDNTLYKDPKDEKYYLVYEGGRNAESEFWLLMKHMREFGEPIRYNPDFKYYIEEHFELVIEDEALQMLSEI